MPLILLIALLALGQNEAPSPDAPFTVIAASGREVRVDIGADATRARLLRRATVLTASSAVRATFSRSERKCEWMGPEDDETNGVCHFEAVLRASSAVNGAVGVLPGSPDVRDVRAVESGAEQPIGAPGEWVNAGAVGRYRWAQFPDGVFLASDDMGRDFFAPPIALAGCARRAAAPFTILVCQAAELLYEGTRGIAASFADYSEASVQPRVRFRLDGRDAVLIRLGLKAEVVAALLVKQPDGSWRLSFRRADYALLC